MTKSIVRSVVGLSLCICAHTLSAVEMEETSDLPDPALTLGAEGGDDYASFYADVMLPLYRTGQDAWLFNFRSSGADEGEQELNLGFVYRYLLEPADLILGGNIYYDSRWTEYNNQFDQLGLGIELLSTWVDARANLYLPEDKEVPADEMEYITTYQESTTVWYEPYAQNHEIHQKGYTKDTTYQTTYIYENYERAREGYDFEIGFRLPVEARFGEYRIFGGHYSWESEFTTGDDEEERSDVEGFKGRFEARLFPAMYLDVTYFEDDDLCGSEWVAGARLNLPFDIHNLAQGKNPFAGGLAGKRTSALSERLSEMVIRDLKIRMERSDYKENPDKRTQEVINEDKDDLHEVLKTNVTFVDDNAKNDPGPNDPSVSDPNEDGSADHPYDEIQEGVDNANSPVFVFDGTYDENVTVDKDVELIGSGFPFNGGKTLGNGWPTVNGWNGGANGPAFYVDGNSGANTVSISGFDLLSSENGVLDPSTDIGEEAVLAENVMDFEFSYNRVRDTAAGLILLNDNGVDGFTADIHHNTFYRLGAGLVALSANGDGAVTVRGNSFLWTGLGMLAGSIDMGGPRGIVDLDIAYNDIGGGGGVVATSIIENVFGLGLPPLGDQLPSIGGIAVVSYGLSTVNADIRKNTIRDNLLGAAALSFGQDARLDVSLNDNMLRNNLLGIAGIAIDGSKLDFRALDNVIDGGTPGGLLPVDLGLGGILLVAADINSDGDAAKINDFLISGNNISDQLFGIGAIGLDLGADGARLRRGEVRDNTVDSLIGFLGLGYGDGASLSGLSIHDNLFASDGLGLFGENAGLAGILVAGLDGANARANTVHRNTIRNHTLGIGYLGLLDDVGMNDLSITDNRVLDATLGILAVSEGSGSSMRNLDISGNRITGDDHLNLFAGLLPDIPDDKGLMGILVLGIDNGSMRYGGINGNVIDDTILGIGAIGVNAGNMRDWEISGNTLNNPFVGIVAAAIDGTRMEVEIRNNTLRHTGGYGGFVPPLFGGLLPALPAVPGLPASPIPLGILAASMDGAGNSEFDVRNNSTTGFNLDIIGLQEVDNGEDFIFGANSGDLAILYFGDAADLTNLGNPLPLITVP